MTWTTDKLRLITLMIAAGPNRSRQPRTLEPVKESPNSSEHSILITSHRISLRDGFCGTQPESDNAEHFLLQCILPFVLMASLINMS